MKDPALQDDVVFAHSKRELKVLLLVWLIWAVWVLGVSWLFGRSVDVDNPATMLGMPAWAFWGVALPWLGANVITVWFCLKFMADDPLGETEHLAGDREEIDHE